MYGRRRLPGSAARAWLDHRIPIMSTMTAAHKSRLRNGMGRYEVGEDDAGVSPEGIGAAAALCLRARPLSGVGSVTMP